jgi:putative addiction module component (TIGR02574 family)
MTKSTELIESQLMALPYIERAELVSRVLASLEVRDLSVPAHVEKAWLEEASRRYDALKRGDDSGLSHDEVFTHLRHDAH